MSRIMVESNIEWLGNIPNDWSVGKFKNVLNERNQPNKDGSENYILSLTIADGVIPYSEKQTGGNKAKEDITQYKIAKKNDIIINSMNVVVGAVGISKYNGVISPVYYSFYEKNGISNHRYYYYLFMNKTYQDHLFGMGNGILVRISEESGKMNTIRKKIPVEKIKNDFIPIPSLDEQRKIADYLDVKCCMIDQIIRDNNKEIELLENLKEIKIYSILKNYPKVKIKYIISGIKDGTHGSFNRVDDGEYLLSSKNLTEKGIIIGDNESKISIDDYNLIVANGYPKKGDVMFCSVGNVGKTCIYDFEKSYAFQRSVSFLRTNNLMNNKILLYNTKTSFFKGEVESSINKAIQDGLYMNQIKDLKVFLPPISIQEKLANDIEKYVIKFDKIIEYRQKIIEKLEEYKKSLIYEVVTGKKEV